MESRNENQAPATNAAGLMGSNLFNIVKSDGAAVIIGGESWCMGVTPDESQLKDLAKWMTRTHGDCTGLFTESLCDAGYPGSDMFGDAVCGMAAERFSSSGFLFLFRSTDEDRNDTSLPWEAADIKSAHTLRDVIKDVYREENMGEGEEENMEFNNMEASGMELDDQKEFCLGNVINALVSQATMLLKEKNLRLVLDIPENIKAMRLCGDEIKLQYALLGFLDCIAHCAPPSPGGWVEIQVSQVLKLIKNGVEYVHLQFIMSHPGKGLLQDIIDQMFGRKSCRTKEGVTLNIYQKIMREMNGYVHYVGDEIGFSYFQVEIELKMVG